MNELIFIALSSFAVDDKRPLQMLEQSGYPFKIHSSGKRITTNELLETGKEASVIVAGVEPYDLSILSQLPNLRCISRLGVGVDAINLEEAKRLGITVTNTPDIPTAAVAELALTMFLALSRRTYTQASLLKNGRWEKLTTHLLSGRTVGLIGLGRIGQRVAQLCLAFGAKVIAFDPLIDKSISDKLNVSLVNKLRLIETADIISIHASKNSGNSVIIGKEEFSIMKDDAILVNLSRGEMIDEDALVSVLEEGKLLGVGLDVFNKEPYNGPLCKFEQVLLTPHSATLTFETRSAMEIQSVENAISFLKNEIEPNRRVI